MIVYMESKTKMEDILLLFLFNDHWNLPKQDQSSIFC